MAASLTTRLSTFSGMGRNESPCSLYMSGIGLFQFVSSGDSTSLNI